MLKTILSYVIIVIEVLGVFIITVGTLKAFIRHLQNVFAKQKYRIKNELAERVVLGLTFLMASEALGTIFVTEYKELAIIAGVIVLRIALTLSINYGIKCDNKLMVKECAVREVNE